MRSVNKQFLKEIICLVIMCNLSSCQISDGQLQCIGNIYPSLPDQQLKAGTIGQYYYDDLVASMKNEPKNDEYYYYFEIEGQLPDGIEIYSDHRTLYFEGMPLIAGKFKFNINLNIEPYYPEPSVCINYDVSKEFIIIID